MKHWGVFIFLVGMISLFAADPVAQTLSSVSRQDVPKFIGCVNRAGMKGKGEGPQWFFILKLSNGSVETVRGNADTTDGWHICDPSYQRNRPGSVTLEKEGCRQTVLLAPDTVTTRQ